MKKKPNITPINRIIVTKKMKMKNEYHFCQYGFSFLMFNQCVNLCATVFNFCQIHVYFNAIFKTIHFLNIEKYSQI